MSAPSFAPTDYLDLEQTEHGALFEGVAQTWEVLFKLSSYWTEQIQPANHGKMIGHPGSAKKFLSVKAR